MKKYENQIRKKIPMIQSSKLRTGYSQMYLQLEYFILKAKTRQTRHKIHITWTAAIMPASISLCKATFTACNSVQCIHTTSFTWFGAVRCVYLATRSLYQHTCSRQAWMDDSKITEARDSFSGRKIVQSIVSYIAAHTQFYLKAS